MKKYILFFVLCLALVNVGALAAKGVAVELDIHIDGQLAATDATHVKTFSAAVNKVGNQNPSASKLVHAVFHLDGNTTETGSSTVPGYSEIELVNDSGNRAVINYSGANAKTRYIGVAPDAKLTIGGGTSSAPVIIRGTDDFTGPVLIKANGGRLTLEDYAELCLGENVIWVTGGAEVTMNGGVVAGGTRACVNVTSGTFNMNGGYVVGRYTSGGTNKVNFAANPILDYSNVVGYFSEKVLVNRSVYAYLKSLGLTTDRSRSTTTIRATMAAESA